MHTAITNKLTISLKPGDVVRTKRGGKGTWKVLSCEPWRYALTHDEEIYELVLMNTATGQTFVHRLAAWVEWTIA